jgi:hypothetical protein|nr:MAG TPA: hypothetical protein [Caudoviricetes sp.]
MLKKIIATILVVIVMASMLVIPANAIAMREDDRPIGVIGLDLLIKLYDKYRDSEEEPTIDYEITMAIVDGHWLVQMEGRDAFDGYCAAGCYDHYPTEEDMNILWVNRVTESELDEILDVLN